jgi:hypothetical protein
LGQGRPFNGLKYTKIKWCVERGMDENKITPREIK